MKPPAGYRWDRPHISARIIVSLAVLTLIGLGLWQVQRLQWKEALIAEIARANEQSPIEGWPNDAASLGWRRAQLEGEFLYQDEFHLAARYYEGQLGYHILTPFQLEDGRVIVINRGWVPVDKKEAANRLEGQESGPRVILVQIRTDSDKTFFTPEAEITKNIWFWRDIEQMRHVSGLKLEAITADLLHTTPTGGFPIASEGEIRLRNDHLGYAIIWFSLALAATVMFVVYHLKPLKDTA